MRPDFWKRRLTLRSRLTLWTAALLLVIGTAEWLFIDALASSHLSQSLLEPLRMVEISLSTDPFISGESLPEPPSFDRAPTAPGPLPLARGSEKIAHTVPETKRSVAVEKLLLPPLTEKGNNEQSLLAMLNAAVMKEYRWISLLSVALATFFGAVGAYVLSARALDPVRKLSEAVRKMHVGTLDERLPVEGPPDEVRVLAESFNDLLAHLERSFRQQGDFVAAAAHELRTPLTTLRTLLDNLATELKRDQNGNEATWKGLDRAVERLQETIEGLLVLARGEGNLEREAVSLAAVLFDVVEELSPLAEAHGVSLTIDIDDAAETEAFVVGDRRLIERAVANLIDNAVRYNRPDGRVWIRLLSDSGTFWTIRVEDTGLGIPKEAQERIFERFYRLDDSRSRKSGGVGLGLAIVRHVAELHGGTVEVESTPGKGSVFTLRFPLEEDRTVRP
ncbi:MAG: Phosphate regulon sensor protein PhoR (SphS) [Candidatus Carbobacillus altaicus]|uniref:histidine kinase n=1 Tax=Candidatus Carbonibacillus altaicus TaxID=2163959 RepID=A0A2R6XYV7_9BACL|nr:MAG: Phosphate regulon sensor protein PhoR (SphS) [Candidatus Carbobacillus altaicus]